MTAPPRQPFLSRSGAARAGAWIGLGFYLALFVQALAGSGGFSVMGVKNEALTRVVQERYLFAVLAHQAKAALAYAVIGLTIGAGLGVWGRFLLQGYSGRRPRGILYLGVFASLCAIHLYIFARGVILHPQLYTERLYDAGGAGRWFQVALTDRLSLPLMNAAAGLCAAAALAVSIRARRPHWVGRLRAIPRRAAAASAAGIIGLAALSFIPSYVTFRASSGVAHSDRPNVLLLAVDSLRYDHLSCHGYGREAAPSIDALCRAGVDFEQAYVSLPRTFPSLVTMLTGLYPDRHGVRHMFPTAEDRDHPLPGLPRALSEAGYRTAAISDFSGDVLTRVDLGFDRVRAPHFNFPALLKMRGLEIHASLLPYLSNDFGRGIFPEMREFVQASDPALLGREAARAIEKMKDGPFFLTVFFSTPHFPYSAPYPDYLRFTDSDYRGPYKYHKPNRINLEETVGAEDIEQIRDLYDGAVHSVDREIGRILEAVRRTGLADRTIVILTADHGEHLYELDRGMGHGEHLRGDSVLRVPFIWHDPIPGMESRKIRAAVRSVDLTPTILDRLGIPDGTVRDGVSLMPMLRGERADLGLPVFAETGIWFVESGREFFQGQRLDYPNVVQLMEVDPHRDDEIVLKEEYRNLIEAAKHRMIQKGRYKLISIPTRNGVRYELYDHANDPEDRRPLDPAAHRAVFESLRNELWAWMERDPSVLVKNGYRLPRPR